MTEVVAQSPIEGMKFKRDKIDNFDTDIAYSAVERLLTVREIGIDKQALGLDVVNEAREEEVRNNYADIFEQNGLPRELGTKLAAAVIDISREVQYTDRRPEGV